MADYHLLIMVIKSYWKLMLLEDSMQRAWGMQYASECLDQGICSQRISSSLIAGSRLS
jgi:hypothetical protein